MQREKLIGVVDQESSRTRFIDCRNACHAVFQRWDCLSHDPNEGDNRVGDHHDMSPRMSISCNGFGMRYIGLRLQRNKMDSLVMIQSRSGGHEDGQMTSSEGRFRINIDSDSASAGIYEEP